MVDIVLLVGRLLLLALLYLFLFAAVRAGIGLVKGSGPGERKAGLALKVMNGPRELKGTKVAIAGPIVIGRTPGADIVIADDFISSQHARVLPQGDAAMLEDLGSTNGTVLNGQRISSPSLLDLGDEIELGTVTLKVVRS
ncbi:MAG: FHA domain-containing protein [Actinobacteria bacterium]|nr:FHA domain-containing protein [Actinomycetota bacterium]MCG2807180.1 FHA domain-containing protein [Coriobacteriia bacterium]